MPVTVYTGQRLTVQLIDGTTVSGIVTRQNVTTIAIEGRNLRKCEITRILANAAA